ncbi:MAG: hypothetical protein V3V06_08455, partial [Dehalococcoidia bacterium]
EAEDLERFGRLSGYADVYSSLAAVIDAEGVFFIGTSVSLYENTDGASGDLKDEVEDSRRQIGMTSDDVTLEDAEEFEVDGIGDESAGLVLTLSVSGDEKLTFYGTLVGFRRGRLIGSSIIARFDDEDAQEEAAALAGKLDERILAALRGEVTPLPKPTPTALEPSPTPTPTATAAQPTPTPALTSTPTVVPPTPTPTPGPTAQRIAYIGTDGNIWITNADGSGLAARLTDINALDGTSALDFDWSPDGVRVAFLSWNALYVINADGSGVARLIEGLQYNFSWSPDGARIALPSSFVDGIYVINADGSGLTRLTDGSSLDWSPDSARIAFISSDGIYVMNADGSGRTRLTNTAGFFVDWSPDGARIVFDTSDGIYVINADGSDRTHLTDSLALVVDWSPDGARILYQGMDGLYVINADGSGATRLTDARASYFDWSPDGARIVFDTSDGIYVMNADGSNLTRLAGGSRPAWQPRPTP